MFCSNYLFIKDHYIRTLQDLKQVFKVANLDTSGPYYLGLQDVILNKTIISWMENKVESEVNKTVEEICNSVITHSITLDEGIKQITKALCIDIEIEREWRNYISFLNDSFTIEAQTGNLSQDDTIFLYKRDDDSVKFSISVKYKVKEPLDHNFYFIAKISNNITLEEIKGVIRPAVINTKTSIQEKNVCQSIRFDFDYDLPEGIYRINLLDFNDKDSKAIFSGNLKVVYYSPEECIKIRKVFLLGDNIFTHREIKDTVFAIEDLSKELRVHIECDILKKVSHYKFDITLLDENDLGLQRSNRLIKCNFSETYSIRNLKSGIYYFNVKCQGHNLYHGTALYVTGGKRKITIGNDIQICFIEIVDKEMHYMVADKFITNETYKTLNGVNYFLNTENTSEFPCPFCKTKDGVTFDTYISNFVEKINTFWKNSESLNLELKYLDKQNLKCHPISLEQWRHCLNNGNIQYENDLQNTSWYVGNSESILHNVGIRQATLLGLYDLCGNISTFTNTRIRKWIVPHYYIVGGNSKSSIDDLKSEKLISFDDGSIFVGLRLVIDLPIINDKRFLDISEYDNYIDIEDSAAYRWATAPVS